jgi:hypothetical protein
VREHVKIPVHCIKHCLYLNNKSNQIKPQQESHRQSQLHVYGVVLLQQLHCSPSDNFASRARLKRFRRFSLSIESSFWKSSMQRVFMHICIPTEVTRPCCDGANALMPAVASHPCSFSLRSTSETQLPAQKPAMNEIADFLFPHHSHPFSTSARAASARRSRGWGSVNTLERSCEAHLSLVCRSCAPRSEHRTVCLCTHHAWTHGRGRRRVDPMCDGILFHAHLARPHTAPTRAPRGCRCSSAPVPETRKSGSVTQVRSVSALRDNSCGRLALC